jgi:hypothetical protein
MDRHASVSARRHPTCAKSAASVSARRHPTLCQIGSDGAGEHDHVDFLPLRGSGLHVPEDPLSAGLWTLGDFARWT